MNRYLNQLHADIAYATANVPNPFVETTDENIWDWISPEEERQMCKKKSLEEWTGISKEAFPPDDQLSDEQVELLFEAASKMLSEFNMHIVFHLVNTPIRDQYKVLRAYWDQELPMLQRNMGFFETCPEENTIDICLLGDRCHCKFFKEMSADWVDEDLTPEEERARALEIEVRHIQKKYEDDWMKYYPYHLDPDYDDENGNPYDYGFGDGKDEEDDDDWWKR
jgi:hypothetical protein